MDKLPEAFRRFEERVDTSRIRTLDQLLLSFRWCAGEKWKSAQKQAEARKRGIPVPREPKLRPRTPEEPRPIVPEQPKRGDVKLL